MRAFALSINCFAYPCFSLQPSKFNIPAILPLFPYKPTNPTSLFSPRATTEHFIFPFRPTPHCSKGDPTFLDDNDFDTSNGDADDDDDDYYLFTDEGSDSVREDGVFIEVKRVGKNSRSIRSKIAIDASLDAVWNILTDYEKLADFIPGLAVSKLIDKKDKFARLYQIGQQNLPFGLKFNAKAVLDCYEKDLEAFDFGKKRDIEFKMTEGDFQFFEGKWSIEQFNKPRPGDDEFSFGEEYETTLSYLVDVKPKLWLPVHLIESRICQEIKVNLSCIRKEAQKVIHNGLHAQW